MNRRTLARAALLALALALVTPAVSGAVTHQKVGPRQVFSATVNGSLGRAAPAIIRVVCPGPSTVGQRGQPLSGQTVEVSPAATTAVESGFTGNDATTIAVFFGPPSPSAAGPGQVRFGRYDVPKAIPTSLSFPCGGTGVVTFVPLPGSPPTSRTVGGPVDYANVAVAPA